LENKNNDVMKRQYVRPFVETDNMYLGNELLAGSGPMGGDAILPGFTSDDDSGPGSDDNGGGPVWLIRMDAFLDLGE
jgi:hypothetical protein